MAKGKLTREELEEKKERLQFEIDQLEKIIAASDTSTFEIIIEKIKSEMSGNIAEEDWKSLKQNKNKIEEFRKVSKIIQNQSELLEEKREELEDTEWELNHFQLEMFNNDQEVFKPEETPYKAPECEDVYLSTGDVFREDNNFFLIKKSEELNNSFAIISNSFDGERLLQYPSNRSILDAAEYVGNIYEGDAQAVATEGLKIIADAKAAKEQNTEQNIED